MKLSDLTTLGTAHHFLRDHIAGLALSIEAAGQLTGGHRQVEAPGFVVPDFMSASQVPDTARHRFTDTGSVALRGIMAGFTLPDLDAVLSVGEVTEYDLGQARGAFVAAAAAVAIEMAVHSRPLGRTLPDRSGWKRLAPGDFPEQAQALVPAAQAALHDYAVRFLNWIGTGTDASFLPMRRAM